MSSLVSITPHDIAMHKQQNQRRHLMVKVLNREFRVISTIQGQVVSGSISIDGTNISGIRYTGNISMRIKRSDINKLADFSMDKYIRIYSGTTDNNTNQVSWYLQGTFIINQNSLSFDNSSRTLSFSLSDLMFDLTGDRSGTLHAYSSIAKNSQRIDEVMKNVLELCGVKNYDIEPICVLRESSNYWDENKKDTDYDVPHDLEFSAGVTGYEILDKCVNLYPYWEILCDIYGTFICRRLTTEEDTSFVVLEDRDLRAFVISENTEVDYTQCKNIIEVWGKDGQYYGEAKDETPDSPFNVSAYPPMRKVFAGGNYDNIYDRYKDVTKQKNLLADKELYEDEIATLTDELQKTKLRLKLLNAALEVGEAITGENAESIETEISECEKEIKKIQTNRANANVKLKQTKFSIAENLDILGDDMAKQWAEQLLYKNCRLKDSITLETIHLPFLNDVNCKISYRSKADDLVKTYVVKSITHNFDNNTTTINAVRFYAENCSAYQTQLETPIIESAMINGMTITVTSSEISYAQRYNLYIDGKLSTSSTGTTLTFTLPEAFEGTHEVYVSASADGFRSSFSESVDVEFSAGEYLTTNADEFIFTNSGDKIEINEGDE